MPLAQGATVVLELYAVSQGEVVVALALRLAEDAARIAQPQQPQGRTVGHSAQIGAVLQPRPEEVLVHLAVRGVFHAVEQLAYDIVVVVPVYSAHDAVHVDVGVALRVVRA